jgi:hypothetical protein
MVSDLKPDVIKLEHSYRITEIRKKIINGSAILSTTIDTNIELSTKVTKRYSLFKNNYLFMNDLDCQSEG